MDCEPATASQRQDALRKARLNRRWNAAREAIFFAELAATANVSHAARQAGMTGSAAHVRRQKNPAFAAQWMKALEAGYAALEALLLDQSLNGVEQTETVTGPDGAIKQVKTVRSFPHAVAIRLLQGHRETVERYRAMEAMRAGNDPQMVAKIRAALAQVRARLEEADVHELEEDDGAMKRIGAPSDGGGADG
ncbi:MAG TPA: hypothetical protein VF503_23685 [Sphingobium sp.]|uniref:hypothetical protein n=1 Tax=Sphingobium sp. TaxID=1912891 RepID=UPI002ED322B2